jgi:histidyl-tRNA synthetase
MERVLLAAGTEDEERGRRVFISFAKSGATAEALDLARRLRGDGVRVELEQAGRSLKGQLKQADRIGAGAVVIFGDGIDVKDMNSGEQRAAENLDDAFAKVGEVLAR